MQVYMNRIRITFISLGLLSLAFALRAQEINRFGHFIDGDAAKAGYTVLLQDGEYVIAHEGHILKGNALFLSPEKKITLTTVEGSVPVMLRSYDLRGTLLYEKAFPQTINPALSPGANYFSFYCEGSVYVLDLATMEVRTYKGSIVYYVDRDGEPALYNEGALNYRGAGCRTDLPPRQIFEYKGRLLFFTRTGLYEMVNGSAASLLHLDGSFFEHLIKDEILYFVQKKRTDEGFEFTVGKTIDLKQFTQSSRTIFPLQKTTAREEAKALESDGHEAIRGPLNYADDEVFYPIGNSYGELQDYSGSPYLHPGVDFLGLPFQEVYAVKSGYVKAVLTTGGDMYWRLGIANTQTSNQANGYLYAHLNQSSIPYTVGDTVYAGEQLGTLVQWPLADFHHCHFGRITDSGEVWGGSWWTLNNPLVDVTNLADTMSPVIENAGRGLFAFRDLNGTYLSADNLYGKFDIISKAYDRCNSDWRIDVYELRYSLAAAESPENSLLSRLAFRFDMPLDVYVGAGSYSLLCVNTIYSRDDACFSQGDYNNREYYHILTNSGGNDTIASQSMNLNFSSWDYPNGNYYLKLEAMDAAMNTSVDSMLISINNTGSAVPVLPSVEEGIYPNPAGDMIHLSSGGLYSYEVFSINGRLLLKGECRGEITVASLDKGIYILKLSDKAKGTSIKYFRLLKE